MKKKIFLVFLIAVFVATLFLTARYYVVANENGLESFQGDVVVFSLDELNYNTAQYLELKIAEESGFVGDIRYTTDGSEPTQESVLYTEPIEVGIIEGRACHTIRAALFRGEERSRVYTRSYFIGSEAVLDKGEYTVSITAAPDDFYGIMGIFYGPENLPIEEFYNPDIIANYLQHGRDWEKVVNIEIYTSDGKPVLSQLAGIRVFGNATRLYPIKSLRLYARGEYDAGYGKFNCGFLNLGQSYTGLDIGNFNQLELRSGGNNYEDTMLNDVYARNLAADADLDPIGPASPAAVYINGELYSFMWLQPNYCEKNIEEYLGLPDSENIQVLQGSEWSQTGESDNSSYVHMYNFILDNDMTVEANAQELEEMLDMDNMFLYYAMQMHLRNADWLTNNVRMWRYGGETIPGNEYTDGRWRFLFYDLDISLGLGIYSEQGMDVFEWSLDKGISRILGRVLENSDFRARFINIWCDLMATTLEPEYAIAMMERVIELSSAELEYREQTQPERFSTSKRLAMYDDFRDFLYTREDYVRENLAGYFGAQGLYTLEVENSDEGAEISMNAGFVSLGYGESLNGNYYTNNPCVIGANYDDGYEFGYWLVNGEKITTKTLVLDAGIVGDEQNVTVSLVTKRTENAEPVMTRISYRGSDDWIEITNPGTAPVDLSNYFLSDKSDNPYKYKIPAITLGAGESVIIYSNDNVYAPLGAYQFGFKLAQFETVVLTGPNGTLEEVYLPDSKEGNIYQRRQYSRGWRYEAGGRL